MSDVNWAKLLTKPEEVRGLSNTDLVYYHGVVAQAYHNNTVMLPSGYSSSVRNLYFTFNEELMNRLSTCEKVNNWAV